MPDLHVNMFPNVHGVRFIFLFKVQRYCQLHEIQHLKKETHKAEGSFQVLNMDTICHWAVLKGRKIMGKNILKLHRKRSKPGGTFIKLVNNKQNIKSSLRSYTLRLKCGILLGAENEHESREGKELKLVSKYYSFSSWNWFTFYIHNCFKISVKLDELCKWPWPHVTAEQWRHNNCLFDKMWWEKPRWLKEFKQVL